MTTQVKAITLEVEGSTKTIEALLDVEQAISKNGAAIKKLKEEGDAAGKTLGNLAKENDKLVKSEQSLQKELERVEKRMAELLSKNKQASKEYQELKKKRDELTEAEKRNTLELEKNANAQTKYNNILEKSRNDLVKYTKEQSIAKNQAMLLNKELRQQAKDFDASAKRIPLDSIAGLAREYSRLIVTYENMSKAERKSAAGKQLEAHLKKIGNEANQASLAVNNFKRNIGNYPGRNVIANLSDFSKSALGAFGVGSALYVGVGLIKNATDTVFGFEQGLSKLSSITGLVGKDLMFVANQAINLSARFGTSAVDMLKIFQLVGSAIPKLLEDSKGLTRVAGDAEILAKASGLVVDESVRALSLALAQFQIPVELSANVIDILSTAAQKGKAEIPDLARALEDAGGTAHVAGLSLETTVSALEAMADGGIVAGETGRFLRNILLDLTKTGRDDLNPALTPLPKILQTLSDEFGLLTDPVNAANKAGQFFEKQTIAGAIALIQQRDTLEQLDGTLLDHGNALDQANKNTNNSIGSIDRLKASWDALILSVNGNEGPGGSVIGGAIDQFTGLFKVINDKGFLEALTTSGRELRNIADGTRETLDQLERKTFEEVAGLFGIKTLQSTADAVTKSLDDMAKNAEKVSRELGKGKGITKDYTVSLKDLGEELVALRTRREESNSKSEIAKLDDEIAALEKRLGKGKKTIEEFATGSIGALNKRIGELNKILQNTTSETVISKTTQQIVELQAVVIAIQIEIDRATANAQKLQNIKDLNAPARQLVNPFDVLGGIKDGVVKDKPDFGKEQVNLFGNTPEEQAAIDQAAAEQAERVRQDNLKANEENNKKLDEQKEAHYNAQVERDQAYINSLSVLFADFADVFTSIFEDQEDGQKETFKKILIGLTKFAEAQIKIVALATNTQAAIQAAGNPLLLIKLGIQAAIITGLISAAFGALRGLIQSFEGGLEEGAIKEYSGKRIGSSKRLTSPGSKDTVLIRAYPDELVINKPQQKRAQKLYGNDLWKNIMTGTGRATVQNNLIRETQVGGGVTTINEDSIRAMAREVAQEVGDAVESRMSGNRIRERRLKTK